MSSKWVKSFEQIDTYALLSGWYDLPERWLSDLDIVIHPKELKKLEKVLCAQNDARLVNHFRHESTCDYFVLALRSGNQIQFLPIDSATDYRRNGRVWFTAGELLKGRRRWKGFWVTASEVEFKYLLVKKILKGSVPEHSAKRLGERAMELGDKARELAVNLLGSLLGEQTICWIKTGAWEEFHSHIPKLQKALKRQKLRKDPLNPLRYWLPEIPRIWKRWRYPTGLFVAVLGPDGSGKSTLIGHLERELKKAFRRTAFFHLMPDLFRRRGKSVLVTDPHGKPPRSFPTSLLKLLYYLLDYNLGCWLKVRPALARSTLVFFDRYYDDLLMDPKRYRYGGPMGLARWLRRLIPRPDIWLILDVPEDEILRRKQEVSLEEIRRQRAAYRRLATELPNAFLLDGSLLPEEVSMQAREIILDYLHERYLNRRRFWFPKGKKNDLDWLETALGARQAPEDKPFLHLALPDGRGYLLPVNSHRAAIQALSLYAPQKPKAKLAKSLLRTWLKTGIARHLLPEVHLGIGEMRGLMEDIFERSDLSLAVSLGTPGPHRKPVLQVLAEDGEVLGYVKVGWNEATRELVRNEARTLEALQGRVLPFDVPRLFYFGELEDKVLCVQGPPPHGARPAPGQLPGGHVKALCSLVELGARWQALEQTAFWYHIVDQVEKVTNAYWRHLVLKAVDTVREQWKGREIPLHFVHGDFAPWNAFQVNERLYLYDWEYAQEEAPAGYDLFHFMIQTAWLVDGQPPREIAGYVLEWANDAHLAEYWERLSIKSIKSESLQELFELYLLDRLIFQLTTGQKSTEKVQFIYKIWSEVCRET